MSEALDPLPLLRALYELEIECIVSWAASHGFIRVTKDLDIVPSPAAENLERLAEMLRELDATILDTADFESQEMPADPTRAEDLTIGGNFCTQADLGRLDVMQWTANGSSEPDASRWETR